MPYLGPRPACVEVQVSGGSVNLCYFLRPELPADAPPKNPKETNGGLAHAHAG